MPESSALDKELNAIASFVDQGDVLNKSVSMASVKWHLQHSLLVINTICSAVEASDPEKFKARFNFKRFLVFTLNKIPRGKGKSPKQVRPDEDITKETIDNSLAEAKAHLNRLEKLDKNAYFKHPFFGDLHLKHTKRFLQLHTRHHLKIVEDILKH